MVDFEANCTAGMGGSSGIAGAGGSSGATFSLRDGENSGRMVATPAVRELLGIVVSQGAFKSSASELQIQDVGRAPALRRKAGHKQLIRPLRGTSADTEGLIRLSVRSCYNHPCDNGAVVGRVPANCRNVEQFSKGAGVGRNMSIQAV